MPTFIVDMNELEDGRYLPASLDFATSGFVLRCGESPLPAIDSFVRVLYDEDNMVYDARVAEHLSDRDFRVEVFWDSATSADLNFTWVAN